MDWWMTSLQYASPYDIDFVAGTEPELQNLTTKLSTIQDHMEWKLA